MATSTTTVPNTGLITGNTSIENIANNSLQNAQGATDDAHKILTELFGSNWDNLFAGQASGGASTVLYEIFGYMNAVTLVGVSMLLFYVISAGIIGTAHEGEALGKRYSTLWTPIRSVSAIAMLMPLPGAGGVSLLQALLLMCISVGSNSANYVWSNALNWISSNGGNMVTAMPTSYSTATYQLASQILEAEVSQEYMARVAGGSGAAGQTATSNTDLSTFGGWFDKISTISTGVQGVGNNRNIYIEFLSPVPELSGKLGKIALQCDADYEAMCQTEQQAVMTMIETLKPLAVQIANLQPADGTVINQAVQTFNQAAYQAIEQSIAAVGDKNGQNAQTQKFVDTATERGWIYAGAWYWTLGGMQERIQNALEKVPAFKEAVDADEVREHGLQDYNDVIALYQNVKYKNNDDIKAATRAGQDGNSVFNGLRDMASEAFVGLPKMLIEATTKGDPIANLKAVGSYGINTTVSVGVGLLVADAAYSNSYVGKIASIALGSLTSSVSDSEAASVKGGGVVKALFGVVAMVLVPIVAFFMYVTYYLPAIPLILYAAGVVGWLIMIMETVAIAPLWAAAHAIPEGEGFAGQHGKQGYMLFMNVLMRPSLMVVGFFMSMIMIKGVSWFVGQTLIIYFDAATATDITGPVTSVMMTILGIYLIIKLAHKCFDVIAWLPDNAMKWIGGGGTNLGEGAVEQHMDGKFGALLGNTGQRLQRGLDAGKNSNGGAGNGGSLTNGGSDKSPSGSGSKAQLAHALENGNVDAPKGAASDAPAKQSKLVKSLESMEDMLESGESNDD